MKTEEGLSQGGGCAFGVSPRKSGMTAVIDYGAGNLTSVLNAFAALDEVVTVTRDPAVIGAADRVVFPGVGAAKHAMDNLKAMNLTDVVRAAATSDKPFLGICLGMQVLFSSSEEDGGVETLGVLSGKVRRFPDVPGFKVPEIGWNQVGVGRANADLEVKDGSEFYFVHSYYAEIVPETVGVTEYAGIRFTAMVRKGTLWACQFHPEKSGCIGLALLDAWLKQ